MSNDVGRGCVDCTYYAEPVTKKPCKGCKQWSGWEASEKLLARLKLRKKIEKEIAKGTYKGGAKNA